MQTRLELELELELELKPKSTMAMQKASSLRSLPFSFSQSGSEAPSRPYFQ